MLGHHAAASLDTRRAAPGQHLPKRAAAAGSQSVCPMCVTSMRGESTWTGRDASYELPVRHSVFRGADPEGLAAGHHGRVRDRDQGQARHVGVQEDTALRLRDVGRAAEGLRPGMAAPGHTARREDSPRPRRGGCPRRPGRRARTPSGCRRPARSAACPRPRSRTPRSRPRSSWWRLERTPASEVVAMLECSSPALATLTRNPTALVTRFDPAELSQNRYRVKIQGRISTRPHRRARAC